MGILDKLKAKMGGASKAAEDKLGDAAKKATDTLGPLAEKAGDALGSVAEKAGDLRHSIGGPAESVVDKAADAVDDATKGKFSDQIDEVRDAVEKVDGEDALPEAEGGEPPAEPTA